jgi:hypothetical protein
MLLLTYAPEVAAKATEAFRFMVRKLKSLLMP